MPCLHWPGGEVGGGPECRLALPCTASFSLLTAGWGECSFNSLLGAMTPPQQGDQSATCFYCTGNGRISPHSTVPVTWDGGLDWEDDKVSWHKVHDKVQGKRINFPLSPSEIAGREGVFPLVLVGWSTMGIVIKFFCS